MEKWAALVIGIYLIVSGLVARTLINESEIPATDEERRNAKATPLKRILVVGTGVACCIYAAVRFTR
jgi:hypothetical protein